MNLFDWADYLPLAVQVRQPVGGEAADRCAISRAYYACHGVAHAYANTNGYFYQKGVRKGSHEQVWDWFYRESVRRSDSNFSQIWTDGYRLKDQRVTADYRDQFPSLATEVQGAIQRATQLLSDLRNLP